MHYANQQRKADQQQDHFFVLHMLNARMTI